jgi:hypothetical protein
MSAQELTKAGTAWRFWLVASLLVAGCGPDTVIETGLTASTSPSSRVARSISSPSRARSTARSPSSVPSSRISRDRSTRPASRRCSSSARTSPRPPSFSRWMGWSMARRWLGAVPRSPWSRGSSSRRRSSSTAWAGAASATLRAAPGAVWARPASRATPPWPTPAPKPASVDAAAARAATRALPTGAPAGSAGVATKPPARPGSAVPGRSVPATRSPAPTAVATRPSASSVPRTMRAVPAAGSANGATTTKIGAWTALATTLRPLDSRRPALTTAGRSNLDDADEGARPPRQPRSSPSYCSRQGPSLATSEQGDVVLTVRQMQ